MKLVVICRVAKVDWNELNIWADKVSENNYEISAAGVNMMYGKGKQTLKGIVMVIIPSIFLLGLILTIGLRDWQVAAATIGGVCLVIGAELGLLSLFNFEFSVLDGSHCPSSWEWLSMGPIGTQDHHEIVMK